MTAKITLVAVLTTGNHDKHVLSTIFFVAISILSATICTKHFRILQKLYGIFAFLSVLSNDVHASSPSAKLTPSGTCLSQNIQLFVSGSGK